jgi:hypothetical protein
MEKYLEILSIVLINTIVLVGCSKNDENGLESSNSSSKEYTPANIYNKTILLDGGTKIWGFSSTGSCSVNDFSFLTLTDTPSYTYTKINSTTASFTWHYTDKDNLPDYFDNSNTVTLTFDSSNNGTFQGSMTIKASGYLLNNTTTSIISGTFTLQ